MLKIFCACVFLGICYKLFISDLELLVCVHLFISLGTFDPKIKGLFERRQSCFQLKMKSY